MAARFRFCGGRSDRRRGSFIDLLAAFESGKRRRCRDIAGKSALTPALLALSRAIAAFAQYRYLPATLASAHEKHSSVAIEGAACGVDELVGTPWFGMGRAGGPAFPFRQNQPAFRHPATSAPLSIDPRYHRPYCHRLRFHDVETHAHLCRCCSIYSL